MSQKSDKKTQRIKIISTGILFGLFFCIIILRSYQLQILGNSKLNQLVETQYKTKLKLQPKRGTIYDRKGEVLAIDIEVASIGIHPHQIQDKKFVKKVLKKYTSLDSKTLNKKLHSSRKFEWIERRIPKENGDHIKILNLKGIQVLKEYRRYYPNKDLAGQLLGAVGYDAKALGGIELLYDKYLRSSTSKTMAEKDARGRFYKLRESKDTSHDIYLSIDKNIQHFTEKALEENAIKHGVKSGFAIVTDAKTGEILAMANYPKFNPNNYWKFKQEYWKNHAVIDVFEPGSTFKTVLMAAALNSKKIKPQEKFNCEGGSYKIGVNTIRDHGQNFRWITAKKILQVSSNIGVTKIAEKIGKKTFYKFIKNLGFGQKTKLNLMGESAGYIRDYKTWKDIEFSNIAFGQGISVTGLQMSSAYQAFANEGKLMKPILLKKITSSEGETVLENNTELLKQVMDPKSTTQLSNMLFSVTQEGGTAPLAHIPGYHGGGKTGTAQKFDNSTKSYSEKAYVSSFVGYAPLNNPRLVIYVVYDSPTKISHYGGITAGPVFRTIAEKSLPYLSVSPKYRVAKKEGQEEKKQKSVNSVKPKNLNKKYQMALKDIQNKVMPNLSGLSIRSILKLSQSFPAKIKFKGNGYATTQYPLAGEKITKYWTVSLSRNDTL